ncbi:MAG TPA: dihydropteroate synthase [Burkholderiaceae bacterium]|jgi:dihydropteroate synthase|nr:dihydropteroate synthase [Burkholderiaceae bacterium]
MVWHCGRFRLSLERPLVMGVINVTPDSFSDGGRFLAPAAALEHARQLVADGADILDIGGESTRPGAALVSPADQIERVLPVVRALSDVAIPLSVDTSEPEVMRAALSEGVAIINDVRALSVPGAVGQMARSDCGVVLMHMQGTPQTMQANPSYADVVHEVGDFLRQRRDEVVQAGVAPDRIVLDPGFGFGKRGPHNRTLLARLRELTGLGQPLLVGLSRKASLGEMTGRPVDQRLIASVVAALLAMQAGARIVRVHDVAATRDAIAVWEAVRQEPA